MIENIICAFTFIGIGALVGFWLFSPLLGAL